MTIPYDKKHNRSLDPTYDHPGAPDHLNQREHPSVLGHHFGIISGQFINPYPDLNDQGILGTLPLRNHHLNWLLGGNRSLEAENLFLTLSFNFIPKVVGKTGANSPAPLSLKLDLIRALVSHDHLFFRSSWT